HMVDAVLYFEGDRNQSYRILRGVKNRFGSTNEVGVFEMTGEGLISVDNPSAALLSGRPLDASGSSVTCLMEGTRPILAEIQALTSPTGFGMPRRAAEGVDFSRVVMLIAIIEKKLGLTMQNQDAYLNVVGGLKVDETAADLAIISAIISSLKNKSIDPATVFLGEVGLSGEVRSVPGISRRVSEAERLGFKTCVVPEGSIQSLRDVNIKLIGAKTVMDILKEDIWG
ncbi:MAG: magnesium chelatase domain-containing protein, partial [Clostridia bacterium]|nr:magnesium chelatase domain-containing protein [Clostridia bacterium]